MKKLLTSITLLLFAILLFACGNKSTNGKMSLGGVEYDAKFVKSGYYFDKASLSEATLGDMLSKVTLIDKPDSLGEVVLADLSNITLTNNKKEEITDAMIEAEIEKERDKETVYNPVKVKREAKLKDKVIIDFKGYADGKEIDGGSGEDFDLVLGSGQFIPGFEEKVVGHKAGSKFTIDVTFPQEYEQSLAGKPAQFEITIKSIEEPSTPEVNEDFIKRHSTKGSKTLDEYKAEIKQKLIDRQEFMNNQNLTYQLYEKIFEGSKFYPTEEALAWQFSVIINQINQNAKANGTNIATMLTANGGTVKDTYDEIKNSVPQYIEETMLMDELQKKFKVTMTDAEVKEWFNTMSEAMGYGSTMTYEDYVKYAGAENLKQSAIQERTFLKAAKSCKLVDEDSVENNESTN